MDEIDRRILRELHLNAKISNTELAERVGLSPSPCWNRVRRLEADGVIEKYVTIINQRAIGVPDSVILEIRMTAQDTETLRRFEETLRSLPEVVEAFLVTGEYDYYIRVAISGTEAYERFLVDKVYKLPGIGHTRSSFTLRCLKQAYSVEPTVP